MNVVRLRNFATSVVVAGSALTQTQCAPREQNHFLRTSQAVIIFDDHATAVCRKDGKGSYVVGVNNAAALTFVRLSDGTAHYIYSGEASSPTQIEISADSKRITRLSAAGAQEEITDQRGQTIARDGAMTVSAECSRAFAHYHLPNPGF